MSTCTVAVVSDTHGQLDPRIADAVSGCDYGVHAGDIGAAGVLDVLRERVGQLHAVIGNNDVAQKWPAADRATLARLQACVRLALPGGDLVVVHGDRVLPAKRRHEQLRATYPDARAIVYGHSHRMCEDTGHRPWVLNPGAAGRARTYGGPSCLILRVSATDWEVQRYRFAPQPATSGRMRASDRRR